MAVLNGEIYLLTEPKGPDQAVQRVQKILYNSLDWEKVQLFGRINKVALPEEKTGFKPMLYYGANEYKDVERNDNFNGQVFFVLGDKHTTNEGQLFKVDCKIVFMIDLQKCFPGYVDRADAKAHDDVVKILKAQKSFVISSIGTGVKECLGEFETEDIKFTDNHPNHCFCISGILSFNLSC